MLKAKGLCGELKKVIFPSSSNRRERQDQIKSYAEKGSHSKSTWIQHKPNKSLKENSQKLNTFIIHLIKGL